MRALWTRGLVRRLWIVSALIPAIALLLAAFIDVWTGLGALIGGVIVLPLVIACAT